MTAIALASVPAVLAIIVWAITDLERFVLFVVLSASIFPASLLQPGGTNVAAVDLLLLVALAAWLINNSLRVAPDPQVRGNPMLYPALAFLAINWISILWSVNAHGTITKGIQLVELFLVIPLVFASLPRSVRTVRNGLGLLVVLTVGLAVWTLVVYLGQATHSQGTYLPGFNKNALGSFLSAGLVLAYAMELGPTRSRVTLLLFVAMVVDALGLVASGSRGAMLGAAVGVLVVSLLLRRRKTVAFALITVLGALYFAVLAPAIAQKTSTPGSTDTTVARLHIWSTAEHKIEQDPILGTGEGTYYDTQHGQGDPSNLFLLTWAEIGIPGMVVLIYFLVSLGRLFGRARRFPPESRVLAIGAGGVIVAMLVHSQVDVSWTRGTYSLAFAMMGIMIALGRLPSEAAVASPAPVRIGQRSRERPVLVGSN